MKILVFVEFVGNLQHCTPLSFPKLHPKYPKTVGSRSIAFTKSMLVQAGTLSCDSFCGGILEVCVQLEKGEE